MRKMSTAAFFLVCIVPLRIVHHIWYIIMPTFGMRHKSAVNDNEATKLRPNCINLPFVPHRSQIQTDGFLLFFFFAFAVALVRFSLFFMLISSYTVLKSIHFHVILVCCCIWLSNVLAIQRSDRKKSQQDSESILMKMGIGWRAKRNGGKKHKIVCTMAKKQSCLFTGIVVRLKSKQHAVRRTQSMHMKRRKKRTKYLLFNVLISNWITGATFFMHSTFNA